MKFFDVFAGIGGFRMGLESVGFECVASCEWDKHARTSYQAIYEGDEPFYGDVTKIDPRELPDFDMLVGGFPCQSFSVAGKRGGFDDTRGTMFFELARIAKQKQPRLLLFENVKGLLSHSAGNTFAVVLATLDELGYDCEWQVLNSKDFGVPQNRERVFIIGHLRGNGGRKVFPIAGANENAITTIGRLGCINNDMRSRVYSPDGLSPAILSGIGEGGNNEPKIGLRQIIGGQQGMRVYDPAGTSCVLSADGGGWGAKTGLYLIDDQGRANKKLNLMAEAPTLRAESHGNEPKVVDTKNRHARQIPQLYDGIRIRKLTPRECWRLQGFPDWAFDKAQQAGLSDTQLYRQAGNAVTVNVAQAIGQAIWEGNE